MSISVAAVYENGVLKPERALPLPERERVEITVHVPVAVEPALQAVHKGYGLLRWKGDAETLRRVAGDDEFGILESSPAESFSMVERPWGRR